MPRSKICFAINESNSGIYSQSGANAFDIELKILEFRRINYSPELYFKSIGKGYTIGTDISFCPNDIIEIQWLILRRIDQLYAAKDLRIAAILIEESV